MNLHAIIRRIRPRRSTASVKPVSQPVDPCERVLLEAQRVAEQVACARTRAASSLTS
jgi:hypothetical protein